MTPSTGTTRRLDNDLFRELATDAWITAIALAHGASVLTLDSDFPLSGRALEELTRELSAPWIPLLSHERGPSGKL